MGARLPPPQGQAQGAGRTPRSRDEVARLRETLERRQQALQKGFSQGQGRRALRLRLRQGRGG